jgi:hypothetical protein
MRFAMKYLLLIFCLIFCSCEYVHDEGDGSCPNPPIKFSKEELLFGVQGGVDSIFIDKASWQLGRGGEGCEEIGAENNPDYCNNNYCISDWVMRIECSWFSITKTSEHTILVSANQNETGEERKQGIPIVQSGNCYSGIPITQSAEQLE